MFSGAEFDLKSKESRRKWEKEFSKRFVQPVLHKINVNLNTAQDLVIADHKKVHAYTCASTFMHFQKTFYACIHMVYTHYHKPPILTFAQPFLQMNNFVF